MKVIVSIFLLNTFPFILNAQYDEIKNDPNIVWAQEVYSYCTPNIEEHITALSDTLIKNNYANTLKTVNSEGFLNFSMLDVDYHKFAFKIFKSLKENNIKVYKDPFLTKALSKTELENLKRIDSIIVFNPDTDEDELLLQVSNWEANQVLYYKLRQLIYYDRVEDLVKSKPIAIALVVKDRTKLIELFWLPIDSKQEISILDKDLNWIKRLSYRVSIQKKYPPVKKKYTLPKVWEKTYAHMEKLDTTKVYFSAESPFLNYKSPLEDVIALTIRAFAMERIIGFDESEEEIRTLDYYEVHFKDITNIQLIQDWAWDEKKNKVIINYVGYAPVWTKRLPYKGNKKKKEYEPLFYRRDKKYE
jgi:hypothetical protein